MSKFQKKRGKTTPAISTASLPDIIFMLLFFFMVVTVLREAEIMVKDRIPQATELTVLEKKSLVNFLNIGSPTKKYQAKYGTKPRLQLDDKFASVDDIPLFLEKHRLTVLEPQRPQIISSIKADKDATMGIISDVKTALRKAGQLKVNYSARQRSEE